jgi:RNA polymerase-associated protein LEO1
MSDSEDPIDVPDDGGDDLFGDDDDDAISQKENVLSDRELASDREDDGADARGREDEEPQEFREQLVAEVPLYRHRIPRSKDGGVSRAPR